MINVTFAAAGRALLALALGGLLAMPAWADPPSRAGRLAELNGQVWIFNAEGNEWVAASRNLPVTTGDRLSTEGDARAELRIGSTVLRMAANTELELLELDDDHLSLQLHSGSVSARLRTREAAQEFDLVTSEGRFRAERSGHYRFDRIDDTSSVTVWSGQAQYEGEGSALAVQAGQRAEFWRERGRPQYSITDPRRDGFSDWVASDERREQRSVSSRYVSPEMTGAEDLDHHGRWEQSSEYGPLWRPTTVVEGWAPYRMGHWAWVSPWGWTWVDDAPWGFAPFHYGRWVWHRSNWCWTPGRYVARPVYAPALVAWVGGPHLSVSISAGHAPSVGWFPLGPREIYVPGYRVSPHYVRQVNGTHVHNITTVSVNNIVNSPARVMAESRYVHRGLAHAVTVVPAAVIERRQPVAPAMGRVNDRMLRDWSRERPRAEPPVAAPPRFERGSPRHVEDPRRSRPGIVVHPALVQQPPAVQQQVPQPAPQPEPQRHPRWEPRESQPDRRAAPPAVMTPAPTEVRPPRVPDTPREHRRDRDNPGAATVPSAPPFTAPPVANAPPPVQQGGVPRGGRFPTAPAPAVVPQPQPRVQLHPALQPAQEAPRPREAPRELQRPPEDRRQAPEERPGEGNERRRNAK